MPAGEEEKGKKKKKKKKKEAVAAASGTGAGVFRSRSFLIAITPMFVLSKFSAGESSSKRYGILCIYWIHCHSTTQSVANLQWLHVPACV